MCSRVEPGPSPPPQLAEMRQRPGASWSLAAPSPLGLGYPSALLGARDTLPRGGGDPWRPCALVAHTREVTAGTLALSSSQGCRFCRAKSDELCRQSGSGWMESLRLFWKASCCSCSMSRLACCRSASRSSAVCRLHRGRERDSTVMHPAPWGRRRRGPSLPGAEASAEPLCLPASAVRRRPRIPGVGWVACFYCAPGSL